MRRTEKKALSFSALVLYLPVMVVGLLLGFLFYSARDGLYLAGQWLRTLSDWWKE